MADRAQCHGPSSTAFRPRAGSSLEASQQSSYAAHNTVAQQQSSIADGTGLAEKDGSRSVQTQDETIEQSSLQELSTPLWRKKGICMHKRQLRRQLKDAPTVPPIEEEGLSVLNVNDLINSSQIRHDLNYEQHLTFSSETTEEKTIEAKKYFSAVSFELVLYLSDLPAQCICICSRPFSFQGLKRLAVRPQRFFEAIRKLMKALVRSEHGEIVWQAVDVDMLLSQLRHGTCDLLQLFVWLAGIIKQSCSPLRDHEVDDMVSKLRRSMINQDVRSLARGLSKLFDVFKLMKLDIANHQMRMLLPSMVDESKDFVQRRYIAKMESKRLDRSKIWKWFQEERQYYSLKATYCDMKSNVCQTPRPFIGVLPTDAATDAQYFTRYAEIVFEEVVKKQTPYCQLREPFELDHKRIYVIRENISRLEQQQKELVALRVIFEQCGSRRQLSMTQERDVLCLLADIKAHSPPDVSTLEFVATEIVRQAYRLAQKTNTLPQDLHLCQVRAMLDETTTAGSHVIMAVRGRLQALIEQAYLNEFNGPNSILDLKASEILGRYKPIGQSRALKGDVTAAEELKHAIKLVGQDLAHMTVMQWRVWAELLWFKSWTEMFEDQNEYDEWQAQILAKNQTRLAHEAASTRS